MRQKTGSCLAGCKSCRNSSRNNRIRFIYLSLPMASQPRILHVLDALKDTTASIYFVPDMFITDLIQARSGTVCGTPVIAVCESPFQGSNGFIKRASDIILSLLILALISPLLLLIAMVIRFDSPGPIIFKQRRYGLDGEEILVYKFRSMRVCEDGDTIRQAQKDDARITRVGAFLRTNSLDELPQFINVLQGRMSIVGPRPHAVAHNEIYRNLIKGYMIRHKVKPGITGGPKSTDTAVRPAHSTRCRRASITTSTTCATGPCVSISTSSLKPYWWFSRIERLTEPGVADIFLISYCTHNGFHHLVPDQGNPLNGSRKERLKL